MGWLSPRRALCGGEVLLTSVPFGVERKKKKKYKKLAAQELEPFQVMKAFKEWFIWKWRRPECSIQGPLSHWDAVTADLRSDDGGGRVGGGGDCHLLPLSGFRGDTDGEEKSSPRSPAVWLIHRPRRGATEPAELLLPPPQLRVSSCCDASGSSSWVTAGKVHLSHLCVCSYEDGTLSW